MPTTGQSRAWQRTFRFSSVALLAFIFGVTSPFAYWGLSASDPIKTESWTFVRWSDDGRYAVMEWRGERLKQCVGEIVSTVVDGWVRPLPVAYIPSPTPRNPRALGPASNRVEIEIPRGLPLDSTVYLTRQYQYRCNPLEEFFAPYVYALPDVVLPIATRPGGP